ncbi:MAG: hypothetical protein RLZZ517_460 [Candidatus Parcubacteria bacterium]
MQINLRKKAVIYCRVSTKEQVDEGNSLITQEKACREYAEKNGYEVVQVYIEQGESAKTTDRTELKKMLAFCSNKKNGINAIIVYKIDRLSRNTDDYSQLRILLKKYSVEIKSVTEYFENNPAGRFMENIMANVAQFDNDVRAERCAGGMKNAMREGRYVWMAPVGYDNVKVAGKATIAPNPIMAPLIRQAFEMIAKNIYPTEEVRRKMEDLGLRLRNGKSMCKQYFYNVIKNKTYTGVIEKFGESHKGLFEPIIDEGTFNQVQRVLKYRGKKMTQYKLDNEDFPLRRFVFNENNRKLTGSWSRGRNKKYPFYRFETKGSNYNRDKFEKGFIEYMNDFKLKEEHINKLKTKLREKFGPAVSRQEKDVSKMHLYVQELTERQNSLIKKNLDGIISDHLLKQQLEILEKEIVDTQINLSSKEEVELNIDELFDFCESYLQNPGSVWKLALLDKKQKLQWFQFPQGITFQNGIYGTTQLASVFKTKEAFQPLKSSMVDPTGLEPATSSVQVRRSSQMSYGPK